jgi:hypothetical protein
MGTTAMFILDGYVIEIAEHDISTSHVQHDALERNCAVADYSVANADCLLALFARANHERS